MKEITAAGGVLFDTHEGTLNVLLIFRRGVWDLPKGKLEHGETIEECAIREVEEEVGCKTPKNLGSLAKTYHEYDEKGKRFGKTTYWYAMTTQSKESFEPEKKEGIDKVLWMSLEEAKRKVGFKNLKDVLASFSEWHQKNF